MNQKYLIGRIIILAIFIFGVITFVTLFTSKNSQFINTNSNSPPRNSNSNARPLPTVASAAPTTKTSPAMSNSAATPRPSPTVANTPMPSPKINIADRIRAEMPTGNVVYDPPALMNLDDTKLVNLILGPTKTVVELEEMIPDKTGRQILDDKIKWYGYMQADMSGTDFDITPVTPAKQLVSKQDVTKWSWSIKAKKPGKQTLYLTLYAIIDEDGVAKPLVIRPFDPKVIEVDVTLYQRAGLFLTTVGSQMEWVLTGITGLLIPFALWLSRRKKGKANDSSDSKDEVEVKNSEESKDSAKLAKPKKPSKQKPLRQ